MCAGSRAVVAAAATTSRLWAWCVSATVFIGGFPVIVTATDISVTFDVQLLGTGVVYFVALPTSDPAPHTSEVVALTGAGGVDPIAAGGPVNVVAGLTTVRASTTVGRLQPMTHYNLFVVALDTQGNGQDAPRLLPFSTSQGARGCATVAVSP